MFSTLKNLFRPQDETAVESAPDAEHPFTPERMTLLTTYFPIGKKLRYYPEYQREIDFQTLILAYRVNDQFVYSRDAVGLDDNGVPTGFRTIDKTLVSVSKLVKFQLLLPDTSEMEKRLDYFTRAEIGSGGQFRQGNAITLIGETVGRGVPTVDTKVDRRQTLRTGPFADSPTILVSPDFETLMLADQRQRQRVETSVPASLYLAADGDPVPCILGDFSDLSLRINALGAELPMPELEAERHVVIEFAVGATAMPYRLRGKVFRRTDEFCVIELEHLYRNGSFGKIQGMDIMEIKSDLLNRPAG